MFIVLTRAIKIDMFAEKKKRIQNIENMLKLD